MRRSALACLLAATAACSSHPAPAPARHPHLIELTLQASGDVLFDGRSQRLDDIARWDRPGGSRYVVDPVVIHVPEKQSFGGLYPLLQALVKASRVNLALHPAGAREATYLPISIDHGCDALVFFTGPVEYNEHSQSRPKHRLWLQFRSGRAGQIRAESVQRAEVEEPGAVPGSPWAGKHPPLGPWDPKDLKEFLEREDVKAVNPVCTLEIQASDSVEDVLPCLAALQSVSPLVVADLILP